MNFAAVQAQVNDLPASFTRQGAPYTQLVDALSGALSLWTGGTDGIASQVAAFSQAQGGWLDVWGLLFLVPRNQGEGDGPYSTRIQETVLAWVGTLPAMQAWFLLFAPGGTVTENASGMGYMISLPATMAPSLVAAFLATLNRIRPVGVPFTVQQATGGLYLGTEAFLGLGRVQGSYLVSPAAQSTLDLAALTNNAQPLIPDLLLIDPTVNGLV